VLAFPRPGTVIAIAALVIASSGGALSARRLIDGASIKNASIAGAKLKPHTVSGLQIEMSRVGTVPHAASAGSAPLPATLPHHQSLAGLYAVEGTGSVNQTAVSFLIRLATAPVAHFIAPGAPSLSQCPGTLQRLRALPGNLCVYGFDLAPGATPQVFDPPSAGASANRLGFGIALYQPVRNVGAYVYSSGTSAVTAS
jgi:hypothetical protein